MEWTCLWHSITSLDEMGTAARVTSHVRSMTAEKIMRWMIGKHFLYLWNIIMGCPIIGQPIMFYNGNACRISPNKAT